MRLELRFEAVDSPRPAEKIRTRFQRLWPAYHAWFLREGESRRPGYLTCREALYRHMPELAPTWEGLVDLVGGGDHEARLLSLYRPSPYLNGCSQAVWLRHRPALVRNYDYHPHHCEGTILQSAWNGVRVIAQADGLWGALDGMNEHGLVVSLAFGGRRVIGDGFGIPLVLRYILEFCRNVDEAAEALRRIPSHMAYNVLALDRDGRYVNAHVGPDRPTDFLDAAAGTNHQREVEWTAHAAATRSLEREAFLRERIDDPGEARERFIERFLEQPLYNAEYRRGLGTLYTAIYDPQTLTAEYRWHNHVWRQSFERFDEGAVTIRYG